MVWSRTPSIVIATLQSWITKQNKNAVNFRQILHAISFNRTFPLSHSSSGRALFAVLLKYFGHSGRKLYHLIKSHMHIQIPLEYYYVLSETLSSKCVRFKFQNIRSVRELVGIGWSTKFFCSEQPCSPQPYFFSSVRNPFFYAKHWWLANSNAIANAIWNIFCMNYFWNFFSQKKSVLRIFKQIKMNPIFILCTNRFYVFTTVKMGLFGQLCGHTSTTTKKSHFFAEF